MKHGYGIELSRNAGETRDDRAGKAGAHQLRFQGVSVDLDHQRAPLAQIHERTTSPLVICGQGVLAMS
jgi:hypothetical protein